MEILTSDNRKRTILVVYNQQHQLSALRDMLSSQYRIVAADNAARNFAGVRAVSGALSAAIVCAEDAAADDYALFRWIATDSLIAAVPLLVYCGGSAQELAISKECLQRGAVDVILEPLDQDILLHRINNAIRLKDSATFYEIERMLRELPSNIYLKDDQGRYVFATHYWHHLKGADDPEWSIRGKTDPEIRKDKENAQRSFEVDKEILRTGKGTSYVIEINADDKQEFFEIIKQPVRNDNGTITGIIGLVNDVTETELLRISLEEKAMKDELTGADNRRCFEKFLSGIEFERQLPITFISADCNDLKFINDTFGHYVGDEYIRMSVMLFRMILPEHCSVFRVGGDEFVLVLPRTDEAAAQELIERMKEEAEHLIIKGRTLSVSFGASSIHQSGQDLHQCLDTADQNMYTDKRLYKLRKSQNPPNSLSK